MNPNRFNGIYGAAVAARRLGDKEKAARYYEELLRLAEGVIGDRPEILEARDFLTRIES